MFKKLQQFMLSTRFRTTIWYSLVFLLLEVLLGVVVYYYLYSNSQKRLDSSLSTQANAIMRIVKEKHVDLDSFEPDSTYTSEEDLIWDIIYDVVVFNERNTYIQISRGSRLLYKSANLGKINFNFPSEEQNEVIFDLFDRRLSEREIRVDQIVEDNYRVIVAYPQEHIYQTLNSLTNIYIEIAPIFFIISIIGGGIISQRSLSRIGRIIKKTEEITAQNLDEIIPGGERSDEYGRLVKKMNEMISRIRTSIEYMNQFSMAAAHELKTPLTILRGEIEVAIKFGKTPEEYVDILKSNYEETLRLIKIVDNLFFISKSENNMIGLRKRRTDIKEFLTGLLKNLKFLALEKNVEIMLDVENGLFVETDDELIKQALINLVDNAVKYGSDNHPINITARSFSNGKWELKVSNGLEEIRPKDLEKIFDRFYRRDSSRTRGTGGVGLGLSVVKSIAVLHNGEVKAEHSGNELSIILILPL